jgi:hypothetical protein
MNRHSLLPTRHTFLPNVGNSDVVRLLLLCFLLRASGHLLLYPILVSRIVVIFGEILVGVVGRNESTKRRKPIIKVGRKINKAGILGIDRR